MCQLKPNTNHILLILEQASLSLTTGLDKQKIFSRPGDGFGVPQRARKYGRIPVGSLVEGALDRIQETVVDDEFPGCFAVAALDDGHPFHQRAVFGGLVGRGLGVAPVDGYLGDVERFGGGRDVLGRFGFQVHFGDQAAVLSWRVLSDPDARDALEEGVCVLLEVVGVVDRRGVEEDKAACRFDRGEGDGARFDVEEIFVATEDDHLFVFAFGWFMVGLWLVSCWCWRWWWWWWVVDEL